MKNWIFVTVAAFLFFSGCQKEEAIIPVGDLATSGYAKFTTNIGEEITLQINETVMILPDGFTITFVDVPEDSRCPTGANCIWEGRAVTKLLFESRNESVEVLLETPNSRQETGPAINLFGRTIKMLGVAPYPQDGQPITPKQYRITLVVEEMALLDSGV